MVHGRMFWQLVLLTGTISLVTTVVTCNTSRNLFERKFEIKFTLYNRDREGFTFTKDTFQQSPAAQAYIPDAPWKVLIHGFLNNRDTTFPTNVRNAYLERMRQFPEEKYNVLVMDWGKGACADFTPMFYNNAVSNVNVAAMELAELLDQLENLGVLHCSEVHLIGHSLGSHVSGRTSYYVENSMGKHKVWRISALDPAGPAFWKHVMPWEKQEDVEYRRLNATQATFVDAYHTSSAFGTNEIVGDVDFIVNGGDHQPSCEIPKTFGFKMPMPFWMEKELTQVCSHSYVTELFSQSINDMNLKACFGCSSYKDYQRKKCKCNVQVAGEHLLARGEKEPKVTGVAYLDTPKYTSVATNYVQMFKDSGMLELFAKGRSILCI